MTRIRTQTSIVLGKKIKDLKFKKVTSNNSGDTHYNVETGVLDYLGDEITLLVYPKQKLVTDEGYTGLSLDSSRKPIDISKARLLINSHNVTLTNTYYQRMELEYEGSDWEEAVKKLTACIVDVYAALTLV